MQTRLYNESVISEECREAARQEVASNWRLEHGMMSSSLPVGHCVQALLNTATARMFLQLGGIQSCIAEELNLPATPTTEEEIRPLLRELVKDTARLREQVSKLQERDAEYARLGFQLDHLLAHCKVGECEICSTIICPHKDELHFHHDGCPSCVGYEQLREQRDTLRQQNEELLRALRKIHGLGSSSGEHWDNLTTAWTTAEAALEQHADQAKGRPA